MGAAADIGGREGYAAALADLWSGLARTLSALDALAATPAEQLIEDAPDLLPRLQYELHAAAETAAGIEPPSGTEEEHADLTIALADARDCTAELLEAVEEGGLLAAAALTYEWRAALFGVRLARLRLGAAHRSAAFFERLDERRRFDRRALAATVLVLLATACMVAFAAVEVSPLFVGGLLLAAAAALLVRA